MRYNESGFIYPNNNDVAIHKITKDEINKLLLLAEEEDNWSERVQEEANFQMKKTSFNVSDFILNESRMKNAGGTIVQYPYGDRAITFQSNRHFYRGENKIFKSSQPSLNRKLIGKDNREQELYRAVANLRIIQFSKFIWRINIVPYWAAKLSDINYKALAQHYGFETHLMDLTNDFRVALFFATCKYIPETDSYIPLTKELIESSEESKYGIIYHSPNHMIDFNNIGRSLIWMLEHCNDKRDKPYILDSGDLDGMAFQIGYQPLMRCHHQSGYIFPMRYKFPLKKYYNFEILQFEQTEELSQRVFDMMDGGKKVFPYEGISEAKETLDLIKKSTVFSEEDVVQVYEFEDVNKEMFPTLEHFKNALASIELNNEKIKIKKEEISYPISQEILCRINDYYDEKDLLEVVGGTIYMKLEDKRYLEQRCIDIYGGGFNTKYKPYNSLVKKR